MVASDKPTPCGSYQAQAETSKHKQVQAHAKPWDVTDLISAADRNLAGGLRPRGAWKLRALAIRGRKPPALFMKKNAVGVWGASNTHTYTHG